MKSLTFSFLTLLFTWSATITLANNNPVTLIISGVATPAELLVEGPIELYAVYRYEPQLVPINEFHFQRDSLEVASFFIKVNETVQEIKTSNYKKIIKKFLVNAPYLHKQLGKPGFRYENIPYMIEFYNKFRS